MSLTPEEAEQRWRDQLRNESERRAHNYAVAAEEYQKKRGRPLCINHTREMRRKKNSVSKKVIFDIGAQLLNARIFVNSYIVESIASGAGVRNDNGLFFARGGVLYKGVVWNAGDTSKMTSEYVTAWRLITRWRNATRR